MYRFEYRNKNGIFAVCFYEDIVSTVRKIERDGGTIIEISRIMEGERYV